MADGMGCRCAAHSEADCGCPDVDWTPRELVAARERIAELERFAADVRDDMICRTDDTCECYQCRECILCQAKRLAGEG